MNSGENDQIISTVIDLCALLNVESVTLTGTAAINVNGNQLDNALTGNAAETVFRYDGSDRLSAAAEVMS